MSPIFLALSRFRWSLIDPLNTKSLMLQLSRQIIYWSIKLPVIIYIYLYYFQGLESWSCRSFSKNYANPFPVERIRYTDRSKYVHENSTGRRFCGAQDKIIFILSPICFCLSVHTFEIKCLKK